MNVFFRVLIVCVAMLACFPQFTQAAPGQFISEWNRVRTTDATTVLVPKGNWTDVSRLRGAPSGAPDVRMLRGERWVTLNREEIGMLGFNSAIMSNAIKHVSGSSIQIFAHYVKESAQLRIFMVRMERRPDGWVYISTGDFTPHHGEFYRAYRHFLTPAERAGIGVGYNPFRIFRGQDTDPVFYNINEAGVMVAIGHAMRLNRAPTAWLANGVGRFNVWEESSGNFFSRTVTTHVDGYAKPLWYFVSPIQMQVATPDTVTGRICVDPSLLRVDARGLLVCDAPDHLAEAGVIATPWTGGNLPEAEQLIYSWQDSRRGWTVLSYALATSAFGLDPGVYGLGNSVFGGGGGPITQAQDGFRGTTGDGFLIPPVPTSDQVRDLRQSIVDQHVGTSVGTGLNATQAMYRGACDPSWTTVACRAAGLDPGVVFRSDSYSVQNTIAELQRAYESCRLAGYVGDALQMCTAPARQGVVAPPR